MYQCNLPFPFKVLWWRQRNYCCCGAVVLNGQTTDLGGGGVGKSLYKNLEELNLWCIPGNGYLMGFCTLHCLQPILANTILSVLGKGGKKKEKEYYCTALQMMHGVYSLQNHHEPSEWKKIWVWAAIQIGKITPEPKKLENWEILLAICHGT
jgi:hypothetical protein